MKILLLLATTFAMLSLSGCSVYMAAKQPGKKDVSVLDVGTHRASVIAELGAPMLTENRNNNKTDIFKFVQGYSKGAKATRALFHGAADVFTLGLWEVVGTPTEAIFDGSEVQVEVTYDEHDRVSSTKVLKGADVVE